MRAGALQIRKATTHDLSQVVVCARLAYSKYVDRIGKIPAPMSADFFHQIKKGIVFVAQQESKFAGYVVFYPAGRNHLHLENIAVLPEMSRQGIGKALIKYAEHVAQQAGLKAVELYTNEAMTENLSMYSKLGYVEIGRERQDGFNRVFFRKKL